MQLATVVQTDRSTRAAVRIDGDWRELPAANMSAFLTSGHAIVPGSVLLDATPTTVLPAPGKIICCGLNYTEHIAEVGRERPTHPTLFAKYADTLIGPGDDIVLPEGLSVDWEAELAVVVGAELARAGRDEALESIAGYTVANDISIRDWQARTTQWFQGKAWDCTTPLGPVLVTPDELDPTAGLDVVCRVNGVEQQRGSSASLVFDCADLLAYVSTFTRLRPGDIILTGTPGGVGSGHTPPISLSDGDLVETEIDGIGVLSNHVRLY